MKIEKETTLIKPGNLVPYEFNNKKHDEKQIERLCNSIKEFGFNVPLVVDEKNVILAGHGRYYAAMRLDIHEVPCIVKTDLTEVQKKAYRIADNKLTEAEWDFNNIDLEIGFLKDAGFSIADFGLDEFNIDSLNEEITEDEAPAVPKETFLKLGDLLELGRHRVLCGDSTKELISFAQNIDAILTDPPYGIGIDGQKESKCKNPKHNRKAHEFMGWDSERPDASVFSEMLSLNVPSVIFGGNYFADLLPPTRGWLVWDKGQDGLTMSDGELAWTSMDTPLRIVRQNRSALKGSVHPTQKPVQVIAFCINYLGNVNIILDPFLGSGTTLIAAEQLDRTCYGMEISPHYCEVILNRYKKFCVEHNKPVSIKINGEPYVG